MPRNRAHLARDDRMSEILDVAERTVRTDGFDSLSVSAVARDVGVANNAIYWYFPSRDHLAVATFEHMVAKVLAEKTEAGGDLFDRVTWFVEQLAPFYPLRASLHAWGRRSPVVQNYLDDLSARLRSLIRHVLERHVRPEELDLATTSFAATIQGTFLDSTSLEETKDVVVFTLKRLIGDETSE
ncbi:MAG: TetR/AcrR family transcriptional regulator [Actinomycetota bacterium]|nr:TetR/AcrR family transcriptional regulator [Actinomycetota bacterium]